MVDMRKRFNNIKKMIQEALIDLDVFGLQEPQAPDFLFNEFVTNVLPAREAWRFNTNAEKIKLFQGWLQEQIKGPNAPLSVNAVGDPWTATYIDSAYRKGVVQAYNTTNRRTGAESLDFEEGRRAQFLESSFTQGERLDSVRFLYARSFAELEGISAGMSQQIGRILADGLANGKGIRTIAREMSNAISGITKQRALTLARTEIVGAHAEGTLDAFEELGIEKVKVLAEWSTAGDDRVCPLCEPLEGSVMTIKQARGLIPRHPNCRLL
ncbi:unnamed protein product, partial [marine sediment metagenome]